jgi:hypothetical protein
LESQAFLRVLQYAARTQLHGGPPRAQALSAKLSDLDKQFGYTFFNEERRSWVMSLPTESGEKAM